MMQKHETGGLLGRLREELGDQPLLASSDSVCTLLSPS